MQKDQYFTFHGGVRMDEASPIDLLNQRPDRGLNQLDEYSSFLH